jgi:Holliday junction resolvase RusA-like endonuclease
MVRLTSGSELNDSLNVLAADQRELSFSLSAGRPLRKSSTRKQSKELVKLRESAATQLVRHMDAETRRAFRGRVSVQMDIRLPKGRHDAGLPAMVKNYLDLLTSRVIPDDSRIAHLLVLRGQPADQAQVTIRCLPVSLFTADYDRAHWVLGEAGANPILAPDFERAHAPYRDGAPNPDRSPWGLTPFDNDQLEMLTYDQEVLSVIEDLDAQEAGQLEEDPDGIALLDPLPGYAELEDPQVRDAMRPTLEQSIGHALGAMLTDHGFDARDRPGASPSWLAEIDDPHEVEIVQLPDGGPGCFILPDSAIREAPRDERPWLEQIEDQLRSRLNNMPWCQALFGGPLVLDIALRGHAAKRDIDNAAHDVLRAFTKVLDRHGAGFIGYRVYRQAWPADDLRVRLMPATRLQALARAIDRAREVRRREPRGR